MMKDPFSAREEEIFKTLKDLRSCEFVIIGGYAVNAYTLPRFSVDCDIVIKDKSELRKIETLLLRRGYAGNFSRYEKKVENNCRVSIDMMVKSVMDRMTKATFSAEWIFKNSQLRILKGKTIQEELKLRIIDIDSLIVMKIISCRSTDIRDVFMMLPHAQDIAWIKAEISLRYNLKDRISKIMEKVNSKQFKDGLSGVYGGFDQKIFDKHKKVILSLQ